MAISNESPSYHFHGVLPHCLENRLINSSLDKRSNLFTVSEFMTQIDGTSRIVNNTINLPREITDQRIIGHPVCIGCKGDFYVFQFITVPVRYIQFFSVVLRTESVILYEDDEHYFIKDLTTIGPVECHISSDREFILLRLPQIVLKLHRESNVIMNSHKCLRRSKLLDKKFKCMTFHPVHPQTLLVVHVNDTWSKCRLNIYDASKDKIIIEKTFKINMFNFDFDNFDGTSDESENKQDEEDSTMTLSKTAVLYNRTSDLILLSCIPSDKTKFITVYGFQSDTLQHKFSYRIGIHNTISEYVVNIFSLEMSICNTSLYVYLSQRQKTYLCKEISIYKKQLICNVKLPVILNLKCQVRSVILQHFTGEKLQSVMDSLPKSLRTYLKMSDEVQY